MEAKERIEEEQVVTVVRHALIDITLTIEEARRMLKVIGDRPDHPLADMRAKLVIAVGNLRNF